MFELSFAECALAALAAIALIKPEDMPGALRAAKKCVRRLTEWRDAATAEIRRAADDISDEPKAATRAMAATEEELAAMMPHERYTDIDTGALDASRRPTSSLPPEAEGMAKTAELAVLAGLPTVSAKIRYLHAEGHAPKQIAAILGKRPQHVYGVLRQDAVKKQKAKL